MFSETPKTSTLPGELQFEDIHTICGSEGNCGAVPANPGRKSCRFIRRLVSDVNVPSYFRAEPGASGSHNWLYIKHIAADFLGLDYGLNRFDIASVALDPQPVHVFYHMLACRKSR